MKHSTRLLLLALSLLTLSCALAQDWPQWRGPNRDGVAVGFAAPATWPATLTPGWHVAVGAGDSSPALVGGMLYVCVRQNNEEVTLCLNAADGAEVWRDHYEAPAITGAAAREHAGLRSSPAVAAGKVVTLGATGILSCLDAATGAVAWRNTAFTGFPQFYTAMSPLIESGLVIAHLGSETEGALVAFDLATGAEKWRWAGEGPQYSSPVLMTLDGVPVLVTLTAQSFIGVTLADGKLLWQMPFPTARMVYNAATPIVTGQTVIISGATRGTRALRIEKQGDAYVPVQVWCNPDVSVQFCTPLLKDGLLYGVTNQGMLFCLNATSGATAWLDTTPHGRGFGAMVDAGNAVVALPPDGTLLVLQPGAAACAILAQYKVAEGGTYAGPVLSGKNIFIKDANALTQWLLP
jgi:outer membrane protein assembly factor BamB